MSEDGDGEMLVQNARHQTNNTLFVCDGIGVFLFATYGGKNIQNQKK